MDVLLVVGGMKGSGLDEGSGGNSSTGVAPGFGAAHPPLSGGALGFRPIGLGQKG